MNWNIVIGIVTLIIVLVVGWNMLQTVIDPHQPQFDKDCIGQPNGTWVGWNVSCDEFDINKTNHIECQNGSAYSVIYCVYNNNVIH